MKPMFEEMAKAPAAWLSGSGDEALVVLEKVAAQRGSPLTVVGRDVSFNAGDHSLADQSLVIFDRKSSTEEPKSVILRIPLLGAHQVVNAVTAYAALKASGLDVSDEAIRIGFADVKWPCRFEILPGEPVVILDSAHNLDSFEKLDQTLEDYFPGRPVILIFGASEDKDMQGMLALLKSRLTHVLATRALHPRAIEPENIVEMANSLGIHSEMATPVEAALERALEIAGHDGGVVLSAGSMFVTAEVKTAWEKIYRP